MILLFLYFDRGTWVLVICIGEGKKRLARGQVFGTSRSVRPVDRG
jgi:hypothetical protein